MDALIYDRTLTDVETETDKGFWQLSDLVRITEWLDYLATLLGLTLTTTDYALGNLVDISELLTNVAAVRSGRTWSWTPETPTATAWNYVKANNVEQILYDANLWETNRLAG